MGGLSNTRVERLTGLIFALLLAAVFAQLWLSSAPLPWGGPNVMLAGAAVLLSLAYILLRLAALNPLTAGVALFRDLRPLLPTLAVSALLTLWAFLIHRFSNNLEGVRLAQMILGVGVLLAMYLAVERASRARIIVLALIVATFVSSLFGLAVVWIGDPFLTLWLQFSSVRDIDLETILTYGRTAGLAAHAASFSYQLAAAVPLAFAAILYYTPFPPGRRATAYNLAMFLMLAVLTTALVVNGTRAAMLGALVAFALIAAPALRLPYLKRRLAYTVPALAVWLLAFFNPTFTVGNLVGEVAAATGQDGNYGLVRSRSDFDGLVVGLDGLDGRNHRPVSGHRVEGVVAGQEYAAQVRARNVHGEFWQGNQVTATGEADGTFLITWYTPEVLNLGSYQLRVKPRGDRRWQPWRDFSPRSYGNVLPPIRVLAPGQDTPEEGRRVLRHGVENLLPGVDYVAQLRARSNNQYSDAAPGVVLRASPQGRLALSWREPVAAGRISGYQYRLQQRDLGQWSAWQDVAAGGQVNWADFANLTGSLDGLTDTRAGPVIGHFFEGVSFRYNYLAQLRPRIGESFGAASEEVVVRPWQTGQFVLTWRASPDPTITGYQYRFRRFSVEEWLPWRDFTPTLSSAGPALTAVAGNRPEVVAIDSRPVLRHAQEDFIPGLEYKIQLRARNQYGYGLPSNEVIVTAATDGALTLAWQQPANPAAVTGYQFRHWTPVNLRWQPWQDFAPESPELGVPGGGVLVQGPESAVSSSVVADEGPADEGPADEGPADEGPADEGPADEGPADEGPADEGPADEGPADEGPADEGPADEGPADEGPADEGPADEGPADEGPADEGPADEGPADEGPADEGPADEGPADEGPADEGPADEGPADEGPADEGPADEGPADEGPADEGPADEGPADEGPGRRAGGRRAGGRRAGGSAGGSAGLGRPGFRGSPPGGRPSGPGFGRRRNGNHYR